MRRRLGDEVLDRLVAPLIGGIWAGDCDALSLAVTAAQLAAARDRDPADPSLVRRRPPTLAAAAAAGGPGVPGAGGRHGRAGRGAGATRSATHRRLPGPPSGRWTPEGPGWRLVPGGRPRRDRGAVVVATPAYGGAPCGPAGPDAGEVLGGIEHASVALVGLVVPARRSTASSTGPATSCPARPGCC